MPNSIICFSCGSTFSITQGKVVRTYRISNDAVVDPEDELIILIQYREHNGKGKTFKEREIELTKGPDGDDIFAYPANKRNGNGHADNPEFDPLHLALQCRNDLLKYNSSNGANKIKK